MSRGGKVVNLFGKVDNTSNELPVHIYAVMMRGADENGVKFELADRVEAVSPFSAVLKAGKDAAATYAVQVGSLEEPLNPAKVDDLVFNVRKVGTKS